jgi:hypothetical protein
MDRSARSSRTSFRDEIAPGTTSADDRGDQGAHRPARGAPAIAAKRLVADGRILLANGSAVVTKTRSSRCGGCRRGQAFGVAEGDLRRGAVRGNRRHVSRARRRARDLEVFLPPIGGQTAYVFGDPKHLADPSVTLTARVHDECNGSRRVRLRHLHVPPLPDARDRGVHPRRAGGRRRARRLLPQGRAARSARSPSSSSTTRASARRAATRRRTTSCAPSASRACRTCASRS